LPGARCVETQEMTLNGCDGVQDAFAPASQFP
jgi:hypothetical protein